METPCTNPIPDPKTQTGLAFILVLAAVQCLMFSGVIFGFVPLEAAMIQEGVYSHLCDDKPSSGVQIEPCDNQLLRLYLLFSITNFLLGVLSFPLGWLVDHVGSRNAHLIAICGCALGCFIFALGLYIVGFPLIGVSGILMYESQFYLGNFLKEKRGLMYSLITGCFNASGAFYLILTPLLSLGLSLSQCFFILSFLAVCLFFLSSVSYPFPELLYQEEEKSVQEEKPEQEEKPKRSQKDELVEKPDQEEQLDQEGPLAGLSRKQQLLSIENCMIAVYLSFSNLFTLYFLSTIDQQLSVIDPKQALFYTEMCFYLIPVCALGGVPISGFVLDKFGLISAMFVSRALILITGVILLIPIIQVQVIGFITQPLGCLLLWTTTPECITQLFGTKNFGLLFGFAMTVSGFVSTLSFLFVFLSLRLNSWLYMNLLLLVIETLISLIPYWLWSSHFRKS